jgi:haloacetate dehalogenase
MDTTGHRIQSGHHVAEENPVELANSLQSFFTDE